MRFFVFNRILIVWVLYSFSSMLYSQERSPVNLYLPHDYGGESQNWAISQSIDKNIYVANNRGLLEFNGARWNFYKSPNETITRSVKVIDSLVYTGSYREFGYWKKNNYGSLEYTSLSTKLNIKFLEDEEFWNILALENTVLFQSLNRIHIYNSKSGSHNTINSKSTISKLFKVDRSFYFQNLNDGLYKIVKGVEVLITDDPIIQNNIIVNVFNHQNSLLILTQDSGFFVFKNNSLVPWEIPANSILDDVSVFSSIALKDKSIAMGTISDGIIILNEYGEIKKHLNQDKGLSNNTVLSLLEDQVGNIWLGLDYGINCINIKSPYKIFSDKNGIIGSVYTSKIHNNLLYLGTNQGLFYKPMNETTNFHFVEGTQGQVWSLEVIDNTLFCGHNSGTFIVTDSSVEKIRGTQGTWQMKRLPDNQNLIIQGNYFGLNILEKINNKWQLRNNIQGFDISSRFFEMINSEELFVNHEYKGLFKLNINKTFTEIKSFEIDSSVEKGLYSSLLRHQDQILYINKTGVYNYNEDSKIFEIDSMLNNLIVDKEFTSAKLVSDKKTNKLWSFSSRGLKYFTPDELSPVGRIESISFPIEIRKDVLGYENIEHIKDGKFLLGTSSGYVVFDLNEIVSRDYKVRIDEIVMRRFKNGGAKTAVILSSEIKEFANRENSVQFSYSIPEYLSTDYIEYSYKIQGLYDSWSEWSTNYSETFDNLPHGEYIFNVRGRVGLIESVNTASFTFIIKRPWFLNNTAIVVYVLAFIALIFLVHTIYKRYYRKQRKAILQKSARELELKELENKQLIMTINNERLKEDVENKNRELGIATMNLIKKNEFLNNIKKELRKVDDSDKLDRVVKIIDRNLNNEDDWQLFEEAFNNADKNFLKKLKNIHPELTNNDLRLCTYLRLNLSSKEIAPLLNISSRSVEVKRYRLRKKMKLPHSSNLSNYILEI